MSHAEPARLASLDQFRGYTVLGMFLVNFAGSYAAIHVIFKHSHTYCSYADTIMPQFFFAVGFAYRLTFLRRLQTDGARSACGRVLRRNLGLILLGLVWYRLDGRVENWAQLEALGVDGFFATAFQRQPFQTLVHIGVTSLWILPVVGAGPKVRVAYACASAALFVALSYEFYYPWVMRRPGIDGGPLGFLTWTLPMIVGTLACDAYQGGGRLPGGKFFAWGVVLMVLGYALASLNLITVLSSEYAARHDVILVEPPFVPPPPGWPVDLWTMSQRAGSVSYLTFGAGFSLALYAVFVVLCDRWRLRLGVFDTLGQNALAAYLIHSVVSGAVKPYVPRDAPLWYVLAAFALFFTICYVFLRHLEKHRLYLRL